MAGATATCASAQNILVDGLADGTYYLYGRKVVVSTPTPDTLKLRQSDEPGHFTEINVAADHSVKIYVKAPIGGTTGGYGFAGTNGISATGWYLGRGPDGQFYNVVYSQFNGKVKIMRFSRLVSEAEANALQVSRDSEIKDIPAIEKLVGCSIARLGPCASGGSAPAIVAGPVGPAPAAVAVDEPVADVSNAVTGPRFALIIGNAAYKGSMGSLANPVNDAHTVANGLRGDGFDVTLVADADQKAMKRAFIAFGAKVAQAGANATALFYYAGHGVQTRGVNYLIPVGAMIDSESDVEIEAVAADAALRQMDQPNVAISIVILDACRNMPLQRSTRAAEKGLARMDAPRGTFIAYSTAPGQVAYDGAGGSSPFAKALVNEMGRTGQPIETMFRNVRKAVVAETAGKQTPWDNSSLVNTFVFKNR